MLLLGESLLPQRTRRYAKVRREKPLQVGKGVNRATQDLMATPKSSLISSWRKPRPGR
jgi:hypothetical protein